MTSDAHDILERKNTARQGTLPRRADLSFEFVDVTAHQDRNAASNVYPADLFAVLFAAFQSASNLAG
jgi:hypothetical protein